MLDELNSIFERVSWFQTTTLEQLQGKGVLGLLFHYGICPTFYTKVCEKINKIETVASFGDILLIFTIEKGKSSESLELSVHGDDDQKKRMVSGRSGAEMIRESDVETEVSHMMSLCVVSKMGGEISK